MNIPFIDTYHMMKMAIRKMSDMRPETGIILGSGLSEVGEALGGQIISYSDIPGLPTPGVSGHRGELRINEHTAALSGRFHYYEGHSMETVVLPVYMLHALGVKTLIVTNAAGGINTLYTPGDIVSICDHINLMGTNPLIGPNHDAFGTRFPDMSRCYSSRVMDLVDTITDKPVARGVYAAMSGPCYETPAEIRMLRTLGADLVGMSTVPEVIAAKHLGMEVAGFSCVTNMAAGILDTALNHTEVLETGASVRDSFGALLVSLIERL